MRTAQRTVSGEKEKDKRDWQIFQSNLDSIDLQSLAIQYKLSKERVRQILEKCKRHLRRNAKLKELIGSYLSVINKSWLYDSRFVKIDINTSALLNIFNLKEYIIIDEIIADKKYFMYIVNKIKNHPITIKGTFIEYLSNKKNFIEKFLSKNKAFIYKGYIYNNKHLFYKKVVQQHGVIDVDKSVDVLNEPFGSDTSARAIAANFERYEYLLKIEKSKFIYRDKEIIKEYKEMLFNEIKKVIEQENIYKFVDIKERLISNGVNLDNFPADSLYYIIKEYDASEFNFDKGNRKIIFPIEKKVVNLSEHLSKKVSDGFGVVDMDELIAEGFSNTIHINCDELYGKNIYISHRSLAKITQEISNIFSEDNKVIIYYSELIHRGSKELKFLAKNLNSVLAIANKFENIVSIEKALIVLKKEYSVNELNEISSYVGGYLVDRFSIKDFSNITGDNSSQVGKLLNNNLELHKEVNKWIYSNRKITPSRKKVIRDFFEKENKSMI